MLYIIIILLCYLLIMWKVGLTEFVQSIAANKSRTVTYDFTHKSFKITNKPHVTPFQRQKCLIDG